MSLYENVRNLTVVVAVTSSVPAALYCRFANWVDGGEDFQVVTHVPGANGAAARGVLAMKVDAKNIVDGIGASSIALPDGGQCLIELGEAVTVKGAPLRVGGNSTEVDGAAYLANATGDVIVGYALSLGAVGDIIPFQFVGYAGVAP